MQTTRSRWLRLLHQEKPLDQLLRKIRHSMSSEIEHLQIKNQWFWQMEDGHSIMWIVQTDISLQILIPFVIQVHRETACTKSQVKMTKSMCITKTWNGRNYSKLISTLRWWDLNYRAIVHVSPLKAIKLSKKINLKYSKQRKLQYRPHPNGHREVFNKTSGYLEITN